MSTSESCKDGASKSKSDDVCEVKDMLQNMSTDDVSICANCGKEGANNACNKCNMVKYCNAVCKKVHKKKHKKQCEEHQRLAVEKHNEELRLAAEKHDEELFKQPPPEEDCPICFLILPTFHTGYRYMSCCGKTICSGCIHAPVYDDQGNKADIIKQNECPFCRTIAPKTEKEINIRNMKRVETGDPIAIYNQGNYYIDGRNGFPQDYIKAIELWHRAAELGDAFAYTNIGASYENGDGVEVDKKKATHYFELAAMLGHAGARYNLGMKEEEAGNIDRAIKHYMIATRSGYAKSLELIKELYTSGHATKDDYTRALQSYQEYLGEIRSVQRDKAAADREEYRYY